MDPSIFDGLIVGFVGAAGALVAIHKVTPPCSRWRRWGRQRVDGGRLPRAGSHHRRVCDRFLHNRDAANKVGDAYREWANSARDLKSSEDTLKQAELDVEQAHCVKRRRTDAVVDAQKAYNQAVHEFGPHSQQAQTRRCTTCSRRKLDDQKQADVDAKTATEDYRRSAEQSHRQAQSRTSTKTIIDAADATAGHQNVARCAASSHSDASGTTQAESIRDASQKADKFATTADKVASRSASSTEVAGSLQRAVADLARALQSVPSDLTIRFIVKTLTLHAGQVAPRWRVPRRWARGRRSYPRRSPDGRLGSRDAVAR